MSKELNNETSLEQQTAHQEMMDEIHTLYLQKNAAYGNSFSRLYDELGIVSAATQIAHKYNRLINLVTSDKKDYSYEGVRDTLMDLANYCILTIMELDAQEK